MPEQEITPPLRIVKIQVFQGNAEDRDAFFDKIVRTIKQKYEDVAESEDALEVSMKKPYISLEGRNSMVFL